MQLKEVFLFTSSVFECENPKCLSKQPKCEHGVRISLWCDECIKKSSSPLNKPRSGWEQMKDIRDKRAASGPVCGHGTPLSEICHPCSYGDGNV